MKRLLLVSLSVIICQLSFSASILSPNGNIELKFSVDQTGRPVYEMSYKGKAVIKPSFLGLELAKDKHASMGMSEHDLMDGFKLVDEKTTTVDETWQPVWGETKDIRNHYVEYVATLSQQWRERVRSNDPGMQLQPRLH